MLGGVYVAYPVDQLAQSPQMDRMFEKIELFKRRLIDGGLIKWVFDPGDAFQVNPRAEMDDSLPLINRAALANSDLVVAFLPEGMPTIGVPIEIDRARAQGKHVIVFTDIRAWMLSMPGIAVINGWQDEQIGGAVEYVSGLEPPIYTLVHEDLLVKAESPEFMPTRAYEDDAGIDLIVSEDTLIRPGEFQDVPCGISVSLPPWAWALVTGRSSALRKRGLLVHSGIIDAGYRGPLFAGAFNLNPVDDGRLDEGAVTVRKGERIAQLIVMQNSTRRLAPLAVDELPQSKRGLNGFGSSGA